MRRDRLIKDSRRRRRSPITLREQVARLTEAWDEYRTRFEKVNQDLQTAFDKMSSGTQDQTRLFAERISLVDQHLGKAVDKLAVPVNQLSDDVDP